MTNGCVNCMVLTDNKELAVQLKVEAIKDQILSKLHLSVRPNITVVIPHELVLEALKRSRLNAEDGLKRRFQFPAHPLPPLSSPIASASNLASKEIGVQSDDAHLLPNLFRTEAANLDRRPDENLLGNRKIHLSGGPGIDEYDHDEPIDWQEDPSPEDDYYGKTSEIIAFAEPGKPFISGRKKKS